MTGGGSYDIFVRNTKAKVGLSQRLGHGICSASRLLCTVRPVICRDIWRDDGYRCGDRTAGSYSAPGGDVSDDKAAVVRKVQAFLQKA
jgi:hypothetical protein